MTENIKAYAKINLHLDVCAKRDDGYHDVSLVMQSVSLCDNIKVTRQDNGEFICRANRENVPTGDENIAVRAARLFASNCKECKGALIEIEKNIPMAAGLAGGSTDAAATLVALNRLYKKPFGEEELCKMGAMLGADVPFCISGGTAYTDGRGDIIHGFPSVPEDIYFVIACGGEGVSTPWAYALLDKKFDNFKGYIPQSTKALETSLTGADAKSFSDFIFNIFEEPIFKERETARKIKETLLESGARSAMMSGSGPSVFGIFDRFENAQFAAERIKSLNFEYFAEIATPIQKQNI